MATLMSKGMKRSDEIPINQCIICDKHCDQDRSNTTVDSWNTLKSLAQQWCGLDRFGTIFDSVSWDDVPKGVFFHKLCKAQLASQKIATASIS